MCCLFLHVLIPLIPASCWHLGEGSFVVLRPTSLLLTSHNLDSQSVNRLPNPSWFFFGGSTNLRFFKNICCHALNIYRCYTPGPLGEGFECNFDCWMFLAGWGLGIWNCSLHMHTVGLTLCSKWVFNMEEFEHVQTIGGLLGDLAKIGPSVLQIASLLPVSGPKIGG